MKLKFIILLIALSLAGIALSGCTESVKDTDAGTADNFTQDTPVTQVTQTPTPLPTPRNSISIRTSARWTPTEPWYRGLRGIYSEVEPCDTSRPCYLIIAFEVTNNGYTEISTDKSNFIAVYNKAKYTPVQGSSYLSDVLPNTGLLNGGTLKGSLVYIVRYANQTRYEVLYDDGVNEYNVDYSFKSQ